MMNIRYLLLFISVCVIAACGGGGGGGATYHIAISHSGTGLTCESSTVTITLHEDGNHKVTAVDAAKTVAITLQPTNGSGSSFNVTVPKDQSSTTFTMTQTTAASVDIDAVGDSASAPDDHGSEDPAIVFSDTGFRFAENGASVAGSSIDTHIAGVSSSQNLELRAIRTDTLTKACTSAFSGSLTVDMAYECNNPSTCAGDSDLEVSASGSQTLVGANSPGGLTYRGVSMFFDGNGVASFSLEYAEAGQITLYATKAISAIGSNPAFTLEGESNAFWVRPKSLLVSAETLAGTTLDSGSATLGPVQSAGGDFRFIVSGVNDAGNVTEYYSPGNIQLKLTRTGPSSGGVDGTLTYATGGVRSTASASFDDATLTSFSGGVSEYEEATYSEVGLISVDIQDTNYGSGITVPALAEVIIGRFVPDHFTLSIDPVDDDGSVGEFDNACNGYTYIGQEFSFITDSEPDIAVIPHDTAGTVLSNYIGVFNRLVGATTPVSFESNLTSENLGADATNNIEVVANHNSLVTLAAGSGDNAANTIVTLNPLDRFTFTRDNNAEVVPFAVSLPLSITGVTDLDGVKAEDGIGVELSASAFSFTPTGASSIQRFGRFRLENAFGPETAPLGLPVNAEYLTVDGFVINASDNCTSLAAANFDLNVIDDDAVDDDGDSATDNPAPSDIDGIVIDSSSTTGTIANDPFDGGEAGFSFTAPGAGATAAIDVQLLDSANDYPWLFYNWDGVDQLSDGNMLDDLPSSTATFGRFRGHDNIIYWQEVTN